LLGCRVVAPINPHGCAPWRVPTAERYLVRIAGGEKWPRSSQGDHMMPASVNEFRSATIDLADLLRALTATDPSVQSGSREHPGTEIPRHGTLRKRLTADRINTFPSRLRRCNQLAVSSLTAAEKAPSNICEAIKRRDSVPDRDLRVLRAIRPADASRRGYGSQRTSVLLREASSSSRS
jgi:hypothetical protein